jgi:hypothetical protein
MSGGEHEYIGNILSHVEVCSCDRHWSPIGPVQRMFLQLSTTRKRTGSVLGGGRVGHSNEHQHHEQPASQLQQV